MVNPALEHLKDPWASQSNNKLRNAFHGHMKSSGYVQQLSAHVGSMGDKPDSNTVGYCSFVHIGPDEMKPGAVAMGDPARIKAIKESLKARGIEELPAKEEMWQRSVVFPMSKESAEGPLSHKPEGEGVGFSGSSICYFTGGLSRQNISRLNGFEKDWKNRRCRI